MAKKITAKYNVIRKEDDKSSPRIELDHSPKEHANFLKKYKPCLGNFVWSDFYCSKLSVVCFAMFVDLDA